MYPFSRQGWYDIKTYGLPVLMLASIPVLIATVIQWLVQ